MKRHFGFAASPLALVLALPASAQPDASFGFGAFDRDAPVVIESQRLEAVDRKDERFLVFREQVEVRQGALELDADELEAVYRPGEREPDTLRATGDVRIREGERRAECDEARYDRVAGAIVCRGAPAHLWDGEDQLTGQEFRFDLATRQFDVEGGTSVAIHRELPGADRLDEVDAEEGSPEAAWLAGRRDAGPVHIDALRGKVRDGDEARTIRFEGDVVVRQGDLELRSQQLDAVYPAGATEPEQLLARDEVEIRQGDRRARCEEAEYRPGDERVTCAGDAHLRDGRDELEGDRIAFDLAERRVDVVGRARLWFHPADHTEADAP